MSRVFISYRRGDADIPVGLIARALETHFGSAEIFWDRQDTRTSLQAGELWKRRLDHEIDTCTVFIAVAGKNWAGLDGGRSRLCDPDDMVRREILAALDRPVCIIPVLVDTNSEAFAADLPPVLGPLKDYQVLTLPTEHDPRWATQLKRLVRVVGGWLQPEAPGGIVPWVKGWVSFLQAGKGLQTHRQDLIEALRSPSSILTRDLKVADHPWAERVTVQGANRQRLLILGPPGVGKTTYMRHVLTTEYPDTDMVLFLRGSDLSAVTLGDSSSVWRLLQVSAARALAAVPRQAALTASPMRFAAGGASSSLMTSTWPVNPSEPWTLSRRRLRRRVSGDHGCASSLLRAQWIQDRRKLHSSLYISTQRRHVEPFRPADAKKFFWELCHSKDISIDELTEHAEDVATFKVQAFCVPLFVVICAWLATRNDNTRVPLARLFKLNSGGLFQLFLENLIKGSLPHRDEGQAQLLFAAYEALASQVWPAASDRVGEPFAGDDSRWTMEFLTTNGLLERSIVARSAWSFPHPLIPDYLVAHRMVVSSDYSWLQERADSSAASGLVPFLGELAADLAKVANIHLGLALDVIEWRVHNVRPPGRDAVPAAALIEAAAKWLQPPHDTRREPVATWQRLARLLDPRHPTWLETLCARLHVPTPSAIDALAVLTAPVVEATIASWLCDSSSVAGFKEAASNEAVQRLLLTFLKGSGVASKAGSTVLTVGSDDGRARRWLIRGLQARAASLREVELASLYDRFGLQILQSLAGALRDTSQEDRIQFSNRSPLIDQCVLVPSGGYGRADRKTVVSRSMLVPTGRMRFKTETCLADVSRDLPRLRNVKREALMTESEIDVLRLFPRIVFGDGVELFRLANGRLGIFAVDGTATSSKAEATRHRPIFFRQIKYLDA